MEKLPPPGTRIRNPFNGETFIFTHLDEDAELFQLDVFLERGGMLRGTGRQHFHPNSDEEFHVRSGILRVMMDGKWHVLKAGDTLLVPRGIPHLFRNGHDGETLFRARFLPAHDFMRFFLNMSLGTANHPDWYDNNGEPSLVLRAQALHAFYSHAYGDGIPVWFQKLLFACLAPVAFLRGYRLSVKPRKRL